MHARLNDLVTRLSASSRLPRLFTASQESALTILLYHEFQLGSEDRERGLERLRRQCGWLRERFHPLSLSKALDSLVDEALPPRPLVVTIDDARRSVPDAVAVFREFGIPVTIYVCVGWADNAGPSDERATLSRIVDFIHWYTGPKVRLESDGGFVLQLAPPHRSETIDRLLEHPRHADPDFRGALWERLQPLREQIRSRFCSWSELAELVGPDVDFGSHSVTHCRLGQASDTRLRFELGESRRVVAQELGNCDTFAYPFGRRGACTPRTTRQVRDCRYRAALLTRPGFAPAHHDPFTLPRVVVPDRDLSLACYQATIEGGHIPMWHVGEFLRRTRGSSRSVGTLESDGVTR